MTRRSAAEVAKQSAENRKSWNTEVPFYENTHAGGRPTGMPAKRNPKKASTRAQVSAGEQELANQLRACQIYGWQCEYRFKPPRRWRLDFAFVEKRLAVEVEGGVWTDGRHTRGTGFEADCEKYAELAIAGWRLIRVTPGQIKSGKALDWIQRALTFPVDSLK